MKKIMRRSRIICFILGMMVLNTNIVFAQDKVPNDQLNQEEVIVSDTNEVKDKEKIEVEVIYNSHDEEYIKEVVLEDGTKVKDYDYTIKYAKMNRNYSISQYFSYAAWITRDGVVSLSVTPKDNVRLSRSTKNSAWGTLSSPTYGFGSSSNWKNTQIMKWQYDCHFDFANQKEFWNLEPNRTANSYIFGVVLKSCNP